VRRLGSWRLVEYSSTAIEVAGSVAAGIAVGGAILALLGYDPVKGLSLLILGGFRDVDYLLSRATFIMMTGLSFAIPMLAGFFNIGAEGMMYLGGLVALVVAVYTGNAAVALVLGSLAGAALGLLIAALKVFRGVNEVITAIMLNWTLHYVVIYLVTARFYDPLAPHESVKVPKGARLGVMDVAGGRLHVIFLVSLAAVALAYYLLYFTRLGYEIRVSGLSPKSAEYAGISPRRAVLNSMALGGLFAGLSGALNVLGFMYYIDNLLTSMAGMGFDGIGVALMGRNNPLGIAFSSVFFSMLILGGQTMQIVMNAPKEVADTLSGIIVIALSLPYAYRMLVSYLRTRRLVRGD